MTFLQITNSSRPRQHPVRSDFLLSLNGLLQIKSLLFVEWAVDLADQNVNKRTERGLHAVYLDAYDGASNSRLCLTSILSLPVHLLHFLLTSKMDLSVQSISDATVHLDSNSVTALCFSRGGDLAIGFATGQLLIVERNDHTRVRRVSSHLSIESMVWHSSGQAIFIGCNRGEIHLQSIVSPVCGSQSSSAINSS